MAIIEMKDVYKTYHENTSIEVQALKAVSIKVAEGEFLSIMGESGSGKTTFLNVLTTILPATKGNVVINGRNILDMSEEEKSVVRYSTLSFVFQDFNLLNSLNVYENIALPLMMKKEEYEIINQKVHKVCLQLGIEDLLTKYPIECSGGQRQRIAIARSMAAQPQIIVADEPTGNLDSNNAKEIMQLFTKLNQEGITIIMVTHDSKVASYSKRMIYIHDGEIVKEIERRKQEDMKEYYAKIVAISSFSGRLS